MRTRARHAQRIDHKQITKVIITTITALIIALAMSLTASVPAAHADAGFDASNWQGCVNGSKAAQAGASFGFIKATEGTNFADKQMACSMQSLANAGVRRGVYHFARPERNSAQAEANWFIANTRQYIGQGVIPVLDWEPSGNYKRDVNWARTWLDTVSAAWHTKPLIYMSASVTTMTDWSPVANADYGLWVAGYPRGYAGERLRNPGNPPYSLGAWKFAAAWQYSSSGNVSGVGERVDVNWFYGDAVTWSKYANSPLPAVTPITVQQVSQTVSAPTGDLDTIARAVIRGEYGNNPQRMALLGSRYAEVMNRVNQMLSAPGTTISYGSTSVRVQPGDTISSIAARTGHYPITSWRVPSGNINRIYPGQIVTFNGQARSTYQNYGAHTVRRGESLYSIYGANWQYHARINGIHAPYNIYPGQNLR